MPSTPIACTACFPSATPPAVRLPGGITSALKKRNAGTATTEGSIPRYRWTEYLDRKPKVQENLARLAGEPGASLLEEFPLKRHSEQHIQIIDAIANDQEMHLQLNVPNRGAIEGIPDDVLVEIPAVVNGRGIQNVPVGRLPPLILNNVLLPRLARMENLHAAFLRGDRRPLLLSLMEDPRTRTFEQARDLVDTILAQPWNKEADEHYRMKEHPS